VEKCDFVGIAAWTFADKSHL